MKQRPNRSKKYFALIITLLFLVASAPAIWTHLSQPFDPRNFVKFAQAHGMTTPPSKALVDSAKEYGLLINTNFSDIDSYDKTLYLVDVERIIQSWWTPWAYKQYANAVLYGSGAAYPCYGFFVVDGSIPRRSVNSFIAHMTGIPEAHVRSDPNVTPEQNMLFIIYHEFIHVLELHFSFTDEGGKFVDRTMQEGANLMHSGNFKYAKKKFTSVLERCPNYYKAIDHIAISERNLNNVDTAIRLYNDSLRIYPRNDIARGNLVALLIMKGKDDLASPHIIKLKDYSPENPESYYWSAILNLRSGATKEAVREFEVASEKYEAANSPTATQVAFIQIGIAQSFDPETVDARTDKLKTECSKYKTNRTPAIEFCQLSSRDVLVKSRELVKWISSRPAN